MTSPANTGWVQRRHRPRHRRVRRRIDPPLVEGRRAQRLSAGPAAADHRGRGRLQRLPHPRVEGRLAALAAETGLEITVCHFPPGTSKWNKIEHRLFSAITMNWRGRPLTSHEVIVNTIAATTTGTGLTCTPNSTPAVTRPGSEISDAQMDALPLARHRFHGDWNYTLRPGPRPGQRRPGPVRPPSPDRAWLCIRR